MKTKMTKSNVLAALVACSLSLVTPVLAAGNPWLEKWNTPYGLPPYERLQLKDYKAAVEAGIAAEDADFEAIASNPAAPTFENTIAALDRSGQLLTRVTAAFSLISGTERTDELMKVSKSVIPLFAAHDAKYVANKKLFARIAAVYNADQSKLTEEQRIVLDRRYKSFVRSGALLDDAGQKKMKQLDERLSELSLEFSNRVLASNNAFQKRFGFNVARYYDVMSSEDDRAKREAIFRAYNARCSEGDANDTRALALELLKLRIVRTKMLGYASPADYFIEPRMAKNAKTADEFLAPIVKAASAGVKRDAAEFQKEMDRDIAAGKLPAGSKLEAWDYYYYAERVRRVKFAFDEQQLKPYFTLSNVVKGVFLAAERLYGIKMEPIPNVPSHHPGETAAYRVTYKDGTFVGVFITDYKARATKNSGAWMNELLVQYVDANGKDVRPIIYNVCNNGDTLTIDDVQTVFHEFGHALHGLLSKCHYASVAGTGGKSDYNEIFSQFNENWALQPELLALYAIDAKTGKSIPRELVDRITAARKFNHPMMVAQLCASSVLDMRWHELKSVEGIDVKAFEEQVMREAGFPSVVVPRHRTSYFKHIFCNSGYCAGYYTYIWAEVMDCDLFSRFSDSPSVWNYPLAEKFRDTFLTRGGSQDPMKLFRSFMGRDVDPRPYYRANDL